MKVEEKLRIIIPHWIEHNLEHAKEFRQWAEEHTIAAEDLAAAAVAIDQANQKLASGLEKLGGKLEQPNNHGHSRGGEHQDKQDHKHEHRHEHGAKD